MQDQEGCAEKQWQAEINFVNVEGEEKIQESSWVETIMEQNAKPGFRGW